MEENLNGIRLTDIYGFNENDYNTFVNNNIDAITTRYRNLNDNSTLDDMKARLYLNRLIADKVGKEAFVANASGKSDSEKLAYYNSLFEEEQPVNDEQGNAYMDFISGNSLLTPRKNQWDPGLREYFKDRVYNPEHNDIEPDDNFGIESFEKLYNPLFTRRDEVEWNGTKIENDISQYQNEIRTKLDADPEFTYKMFSQFEDSMNKTSPYYRNYHDSVMMRYTPNQMKDIMAEYYAINAMKGPEEANKYAMREFQNKVADNQGILNKFTNGFYAGAANLVGSLISSAGLILNTANGLYNASRKSTDIDDLNWFQEFLYYAADNKITRYGNDCITTGVWNPTLQKQYKESEYNPYANIRRYGEESSFAGSGNALLNTVFDLGPQAMFTVAGMGQGTVANALMKSTIGAASSRIGRKLMVDGTTKFVNTLGRGIDALGKGIVVAGTALLPAASEAAMDAFQTYDNIMSEEFDGINAAIEEILKQSYDSGEFQDFYNERKRFKMPSSEVPLSDEERQFMFERSQAEDAEIFNEFREQKKNEILSDEKFSNMIHNIALSSAAKNMSDETLYIAFGDVFFTNVLGGGFKLAKKQAKSALGLSSDTGFNLFRNADDALRIKDAASKGYYVAKGVAKGAVEAGEEGTEEGFQTVDTELRKDLASNYVEQWILNRHDPDALDDLNLSIKSNLDVAKKSFNENAFSDEARFSFLMGAVSSGLGSPTIMNGVRSSATALASGQKRNFFKEIIWDYIRNPFADNIRDQLKERAEKQAEIESINAWLTDNDEVAKINDFNSLYAWAQKQNDAVLFDSEADYRDAKMGQMFSTLIMMDRIGGSAKERAFSAKLKELSRLSENSEEAKSVIDQAAAIQGVTNPTEEQRHEIFTDIVDKAKKMYDIQNDIHSTRKYVQSNFGEVLGPESVDAFTYEMIMHRNITQRINDINQSVKDAWNTSDRMGDWASKSSSSDIENAVARRGNIDSAKLELQRLNAQLQNMKKDKNKLSRQFGNSTYKRYVEQIKDDIKQVKDDISLLQNLSSDMIIKAESIAALNPDARAAIIDSKKKKNYSKEQQEEIDRFLSNPNITKDVIDSINDAASLQRRYNSFGKQLKFLQSNVNNLTLYDNEIKRKAATRLAEKQLKPALNAENYEDFKKAVDEFSNNPANTSLVSLMPDILRNNKFFSQYVKEIASRESTMSLMSRSPIYNKLSNDQKRVLTQAYYRAIADGDTSLENVIKNMSNDALLESLGINPNIVNNEGFLNNVRDIVTQIDNHNNVVASLKKIKDDITENPGESADNPDPKPEDKHGDTTLNKTIYENHKEQIDKIINGLVNFFVGKTAKSHITFEDFCTFIKMFGDDEFANDFLVDNLSGQLDERSLNRLRETLKDALDNYMFNNPDAAENVSFKNTMTLYENVDNLLQMFEAYKDLGGSRDIKIFLRSLIEEMSPSWMNTFSNASKKQKPLEKLKEFSVLSQNGVSSEAEKNWFKVNNITDNLRTVAKLNRSRASSEPLKTVFVYDEDLANGIKNETGIEEFTSDNLPLVVAVLVDKNTDGAELIDGQYVLPIGLLQESRTNTVLQPLNTKNQLRQLAINSEQAGIIRNTDNSMYVCSGINIRFNFKDNSATTSNSIRDKLLSRYNEDREKAFDDFQRNIVKIELSKVNDETKEIVGTYSYNGKDYKISYIAAPGTWENRDSHTMNAYIDSANPDKPMLLFTRGIESQSSEGTELYDILSSENFSYKESQRLDVDNIINAINNVGKKLKSNLSSIIKYGRNNEFDKKITEIVDKEYINIGRTQYEKQSPYQFRFEYKNGTLSMNLYDLDGNLFLNLSSIKADNKTSQQEIFNFVQEGFKNLIFEDKYQVRYTEASKNSDRKMSFAKIQVSDSKARNIYDAAGHVDPRTDVAYQRKVFFTNLYTVSRFSQDVAIEEVTVNETTQKHASKTGDPQKDALENLKYFIKDNNRTDQKVAGSVGVTTFINGRKHDDEQFSVKDTVAMSLGTSIDKLVRVYFERGRSVDGVKQWMQEKENNLATWFGFGGPGNQDFINIIKQIEKIAKFFEDRNEIPVTQEHIFSGELISKTGKRTILTAIPDIITVDKNGKYHIYDMKSFKRVPNAMSKMAGFNNSTKLYKGMSKDAEDVSVKKWQQQLTLYKAMMEQMLGPNCVASIGVIPITLDYKIPQGTTIGTRTISAIGDQVKEVKVPFNDKMIPLRLRNQDVNIPDDFIALTPIEDITTIAPDSWNSEPQGKTLGDVAKEKNSQKQQKADTIDELIPLEASVQRDEDLTGDEFAKLIGGENINDLDMFAELNEFDCS